MSDTTARRLTLAAIDIGSNASRLLIQHCDTDRPYSPQLGADDRYYRVPLQLGNDVFSDGYISESKANKLAAAMRDFHGLMLAAGADKCRVCATSAMRDATNSHAVVEMVRQISGLDIEIISGTEEASLMRGSYQPEASYDGDLIFVDVGGGSTEISLTRNGLLLQSRSFQIGSMRGLPTDTAHTAYDSLRRYAHSLADSNRRQRVVCTGGNIHMAADMLASHSNAAAVDTTSLLRMYSDMLPLSTDQIAQHYNLPADRAAIILPALTIYLVIAQALNASTLQTPPVSLRYGIIAQLLRQCCTTQQQTLSQRVRPFLLIIL